MKAREQNFGTLGREAHLHGSLICMRLICIGGAFAGRRVLALSLAVQHTPSLITCLHPGVCVSVIRSHSLPPDSPVCLCSESVALTSSSWPQQGLPSLPLCQPFGFSWAAFEVSRKDIWTSLPSYSPAHSFYLIFSQLNRLPPPRGFCWNSSEVISLQGAHPTPPPHAAF